MARCISPDVRAPQHSCLTSPPCVLGRLLSEQGFAMSSSNHPRCPVHCLMKNRQGYCCYSSQGCIVLAMHEARSFLVVQASLSPTWDVGWAGPRVMTHPTCGVRVASLLAR